MSGIRSAFVVVAAASFLHASGDPGSARPRSEEAESQTAGVSEERVVFSTFNPDTTLVLELRVPKEIREGQHELSVEAPIWNTGGRPVSVYMPAMQMRSLPDTPPPAPSTHHQIVDEFGLPQLSGRAKSRKKADDIVVLMGDDLYGREYRVANPLRKGMSWVLTLTYDGQISDRDGTRDVSASVTGRVPVVQKGEDSAP